MTNRACLVMLAAALFTGVAPATPPNPVCPRCQWAAPVTRTTRTVSSVDGLMRAAREAAPSTTILLEDGEYVLPHMLDFARPDVVLRSKNGDRAKVVIKGGGMNERAVGVALSVSAPRITIADLTVGNVGYHGVQVRGESAASNVILHNIRVVDTGQQLVKVTVSRTSSAEDGLLACSRLEYTTHAPSNYTDGIDALGAKGWVVRDNEFLRIRGPENQRWSAGPAVLFWANSVDTIVERNRVIDSFRGIALGLVAEAQDLSRPSPQGYDHQGGVIRNNVVCNLNAWADEGIEVNAARDVRIEHNSIAVAGSLSWAISTRFPRSTATIVNNLSTRAVLARDGGQVDAKGNVATADLGWFTSAAACDLRLTSAAAATIPAGLPSPLVTADFDHRPRPSTAVTPGAFERENRP